MIQAKPNAQYLRNEIRKAAAGVSFPFFLTFLRLQDVREGKVIPFEPWPHQSELAELFETGQSVIILKARQLGVSWIIAAYVLWKAMFQPYAVILLLSQGQLESGLLLEKVDNWYRHLPEWLRTPQTRYTKGAQAVMEFANNSRIYALASTPDAGRSFTATLVVQDEAAFHDYADENYAAIKPTLDNGGQLIICSTANGPLGLFADKWQNPGSLVQRFYPWWAAPHRQKDGQPSLEWLEKERADFQGLPSQFRAEYPSSAAEAFVASTGLVFGMDDDGVLIFSPEQHPKGNLSPDPCRWEDCKYHYAGVDWGGSEGNPTVVDLIGVTSSGRVHKFHSFHQTSAGVNEIDAYLNEHCPPYGFDHIECGADESVAIKSLRDAGWPAQAAETNREEGLGAYKWFLKSRRFTENPETCPESVAEYHSYFFKPQRDPTTKQLYATKTPHDHHADHKDATRYVLLRILRDEASRGSDFGVAYSGVSL